MSLEEITEILRMCDLFCELSDNELRSIANLCQIETFEAGKEYDISEFLYRQFDSLGVLAAAAKLPDVEQEPTEKEKPPHDNKMVKRGRKNKGV